MDFSQEDNRPPDRVERSQERGGPGVRFSEYFPLIPIPIGGAFIAVLATLDATSVFDPAGLLLALNTCFLSLLPFLVVYVAARGYLVSGSISLIMFAAGCLSLGLGSFLAGFMPLTKAGSNGIVFVHNSSVLMGGVFHLLGAATALQGLPPQQNRWHRTLHILCICLCIALFEALLMVTTLYDSAPLFFVQGTGPTLLRQTVLGGAIALFLVAGLLFAVVYLRSGSRFMFWYCVALFLIAEGLFCISIQKAVGSPIGWLGRGLQYLAGIYLLVAIVNARRELGVRGLTLKAGMATLFRHHLELLVEQQTEELEYANKELRQENAERVRVQEALKKAKDELEVRVQERTGELATTVEALQKEAATRKEAEQGLRRTARALKALSDCNQALMHAREESILLNEICRIIVEIGGYSVAWIGFAEEDESKTVRPMARWGVEEEDVEKLTVSCTDDERGRGPTGTAIRTGKMSIWRNSANDPIATSWREELTRYGIGSIISLPVVVEAQVIGAITIAAKEPDAFDEEELNLLEELAGDLSYGIETLSTRAARREAEEAAERAHEEWERTFNAISDLIMVLDNQHKILRSNKAMTDALGMTEQEVIGKSCFELVHGEKEPPAFCPHTQLLKDGEEHSAEVLEPRLGGIFDVRVSPLLDENGQVIGSVHITRDITEQKHKEEALLESEERFRLTFQTSPDSININRLSDGLYLDVNDGFTAMTGYSKEEVIGKSSLELNIWHNPQDRQRLVESLQQAGYIPNLESKFRFKDGTVVTGLMSARVIMLKGEPHIVSITRNIEEWRRTQDALRESEQRYRTLFEESMDGVYSVLRDGTITDANASFYKLFGYTREEIIGKDIHELYFDPADREKFLEEIENKGSVKDYEVQFRKRDGTEVDCLLTSSVYFGQEGSITGYRGILRDLTLRKGLRRQLLQAQKMEAIGTLAGGIAHDFNNILQVVVGFSEIILMSKGKGDPGYEDLEKVLSAGKKGADLVQRLLTFSRKTEINPKPLNLNHQIQRVESILERTIPKIIRIDMRLADGLSAITADPTQIEQILMNLAVNARDAMPEGGTLILETSNVTLDDGYCNTHLGSKPGEYALLTVSDTGEGMDKITLQHIFEPFFSTKAAGKGTGLGLAMVYGIVKQHEGYITCYSEPGVGTTFKLYFPVTERQEESIVQREERRLPSGSETILVVDDEDLVRDLAKRILGRAGYTVLAAANGREALQIYKKKRQGISLIVLDLIMPEMDGKHCLRELLNINPGARVLVASGYSANGPTKEALQGGAKGFVSKPFDMGQLLQAVRKVLDEA